ncbi:MAG: peroxiredoxin [bacterium TMED144]|nr:MAG: peroxiredoxin [bacterium TMED144]|tara:strand:+ start:244 stop:714 length:471 start_codon:yes stop_codon:yes gene_type:complete
MSNLNETAPDFNLKNTEKSDIALSSYRGKTVVLAFYPGAFTGVCDTEMCSLRDSMESFNDLNAIVLGISVDSPWANAEFAKKYEIKFELLSDYNREVSKTFNMIFNGLGGLEGYECSNRGVVIIDSEGIIQYRWVAENPGVEPNYSEIIDKVKSLS